MLARARPPCLASRIWQKCTHMLVAALAPLALPPDAVNEWFKERRKLEAHHAEPKGALQQPQYMGYLGDVRTLQAAAEAKEAAAIEGLPRLEAHRIGKNSPLCAPQNLGERACAACTKDPKVRQRAKRHDRAHLLFLNTPKSGGSALECATEGNPLGPRWTNMGHTTQKAVAACMTACTFGGRPPKVVVMVRDPYDYCAPLRRPREPKQPTQAHCPWPLSLTCAAVPLLDLRRF